MNLHKYKFEIDRHEEDYISRFYLTIMATSIQEAFYQLEEKFEERFPDKKPIGPGDEINWEGVIDVL